MLVGLVRPFRFESSTAQRVAAAQRVGIPKRLGLCCSQEEKQLCIHECFYCLLNELTKYRTHSHVIIICIKILLLSDCTPSYQPATHQQLIDVKSDGVVKAGSHKLGRDTVVEDAPALLPAQARPRRPKPHPRCIYISLNSALICLLSFGRLDHLDPLVPLCVLHGSLDYVGGIYGQPRCTSGQSAPKKRRCGTQARHYGVAHEQLVDHEVDPVPRDLPHERRVQAPAQQPFPAVLRDHLLDAIEFVLVYISVPRLHQHLDALHGVTHEARHEAGKGGCGCQLRERGH
mmetsp:Transcript_34085/g.75123  ORF Transcript_34085/g.75123 Transcript_34085/m.75123 type:complete len:288 (-) Transcript_34085:507-1370(-)